MPDMRDARYWVQRLQLQPHPEGGFYRETYRADLTVPHSALPARFKGARSASTGIYFLLDGADFSAFHRIASDEMWHFYAGTALSVHSIDPAGKHAELLIGNDPDRGESFQAVVAAGRWFASHVQNPASYALVGCTVAPGFDFTDFEIAKRAELTAHYSQHRALIERLTRPA